MYRFGGLVLDRLSRKSKKSLTVLQEIIQQRYHQQLFSVLIPALEDPEPRYFFFLLY